jgi:hypothetical protein
MTTTPVVPSIEPDDSDQFSKAIGVWRETHGDKMSKEDEVRILGIRDAVNAKDKQKVEEHLKATKTESNWLYEELMKHPEISSILTELSIMGF